MIGILNRLQDLLDATRALDFLAPLAVRAYLVPVFWIAGTTKISSFADTAAWFGNPDWGLGLPAPQLLAALAAGTEVAGAVLLAAGLAVRWISIPLLATMAVAAFAVHWEHGWAAIAETPMAAERLEQARAILQEHGNYEWLTSHGEFVVLNNGVEFAVTYAIMLLVLLFMGSGRYLSLDYWIARRFRDRS